MRRIITLVLAAVALLAVHAQTFTVDDIAYTVSDGNNVTVTDYTGSASDVTIPQTVENDGVTYTVTVLGEECFKWNSVVNVTLPSTITRIEKSAFNYTDLASINLPEGLEYIGAYAFYGVDLTSIDIPGTCVTIADDAFAACRSLATVTFHDGTQNIGTSAFYRCAITSVDVPEGVTELNKTFMSCDKLTEVTLPSTLRVLGDGTFNGCTSLASVSMPEGLETIGTEVFLNCKALTSLTIPSTVTTIGESLTAKTSVETITVASGNTNFHIVNSCLYAMDNSVLYAIPMVGLTTLNIHKSCVGIQGGAGWGSAVQTLTMPDEVLIVGDYAFCQSQVTNLTLAKHMTYIGEQAFAGTLITNLEVAPNVLYIGDGAFAECTSLQTVSLPSGLQAVDLHAFFNCTALTKVTSWGSVAPELPVIYEEYESPFYNVDDSTPLYVPRDCSQSYEDASWGDYLTITEMEQGILHYVSIDPADSTIVGKYQPMSFTITFDEEVSIVTSNPDVQLKQGSLYYANIFTPDDAWYIYLSSDKKSITVWAADYDSFTMTYDFEKNQTYYVIFPAGMVKNAAGDENEKIVLTLLGEQESWQMGDVNHDGVIDILDVTVLIDRVLAGASIDGCYDEQADLDGDGVIQINDVTALIDLVLSGSSEN